jgi:hypothetical protein
MILQLVAGTPLMLLASPRPIFTQREHQQWMDYHSENSLRSFQLPWQKTKQTPEQ